MESVGRKSLKTTLRTLTGMNKMAFRVQKVQRHEEALKHHPQNWRREASDGIPPQEPFHAVPQRWMHKALMLAIGPNQCKGVEKSSHGAASRMFGYCRDTSNVLVRFEFMIRTRPHRLRPDEDLQRNMAMLVMRCWSSGLLGDGTHVMSLANQTVEYAP